MKIYLRIPGNLKHKHKPKESINVKKTTPSYCRTKSLITSNKEKILKMRLITGFSLKTMQTRRWWNNICKAWKVKHCQPGILYLVKTLPKMKAK